MALLPVERRTMMPPPRLLCDPSDLSDPDRAKQDLKLAALPTAVPAARCFVKVQLTQWRLAELAGSCELVAAELVTNAVRETGTLQMPASYIELRDNTPAVLIVRLRLTTKRLFAEVWDSSENPPVQIDPARTGEAMTEEGGRGLLLVEALSTDWAWYPSHRGGKVIAACWDLPAPHHKEVPQ